MIKKTFCGRNGCRKIRTFSRIEVRSLPNRTESVHVPLQEEE
jgi:hypothetical protein